MLSDKQAQEIRERAEQATPGPWDCVSFHVGIPNPTFVPGVSGYDVPQWTEILFDASGEDHDENCAFVAHARKDIPILLAEVERLRGENAALREIVQQVVKHPAGVPLVPVFIQPEMLTKARAILAQSE